ncbi:MAG: hypothetical protein ACI9OU_001161 [Candidatus Promineifilaceae bacterium]|jgi:hypothetical protein
MDDSFLDLEIIKTVSMSEEELKKCRQVLAAVALVTCESKLLLIFNEQWGHFTLPITKLKDTFLNDDGCMDAAETVWTEAGVSAAQEYLSSGQASKGEYLMVLDDFMSSGRDSATKRYTVSVYHFAVPTLDLPDATGPQWLTVNEIMTETAPLMSQTALRVVNQLIESKDELGLPI